jgi:hypothetical protein
LKHPILLASVAAGALLIAPLAVMAQTSPAATNPTSPAMTNPKNADNPQCTQPAPGETHVDRANCSKTATPAPTKTLPKPKAKTASVPASTAPETTPPTPSAETCPKPSSSATTPTPSNPQCNTHSGAHEGGPYGH